jgi:hypothetical protein
MRHDAPAIRPTSVLGAGTRAMGPVSDRLYCLARAAAVVFDLRVAERAGCFMATPSAVLDDVRRALLTRALR